MIASSPAFRQTLSRAAASAQRSSPSHYAGSARAASAIASSSRSIYSSAPRCQAENSASRQAGEQQVAESSLTWDKYLRLRRNRRMAGLMTTIPTTLLSAATAGSYFMTLEVDPSQTIAGIEPVYIYALATIASTGLGWLVGPTVGTGLWKLAYRGQADAIEAKDKAFYDHIQRCRVDPTRQSMQNPVPDYYGEKIGSIKQYRQWLRDQAAYRRKAAHGFDEDAKL